MSMGYECFRCNNFDLAFKSFKCRNKELTCQLIDRFMTNIIPYFDGGCRNEIIYATKLTLHALQYRPIWKKYDDRQKRLVLAILLRCRIDLIDSRAINNWDLNDAGIDFGNPEEYIKDWARWV